MTLPQQNEATGESQESLMKRLSRAVRTGIEVNNLEELGVHIEPITDHQIGVFDTKNHLILKVVILGGIPSTRSYIQDCKVVEGDIGEVLQHIGTVLFQYALEKKPN